MGARYRVTCTVHNEAHERIVEIGCQDGSGTSKRFTEAEAIDLIESNQAEFYVDRPQGHTVKVIVDKDERGAQIPEDRSGWRKAKQSAFFAHLQETYRTAPAATHCRSCAVARGKLMNATSVVAEIEQDCDIQRYYSSFSPAEVPSGTSARRAWIGSIQPFEDDRSSQLLLRALDKNRAVQIDRGTIRIVSYPNVRHPLEELLTSMRVSFQLLLLEFKAPTHPRVYGLKPRISEYVFPAHPHLRRDQRIGYDGVRLPALCVYSAADFRYLKEAPVLVEFLDQTTTFLAKQLIWIRTRRLFAIDTGELIYAPPAGNLIFDFEPREKDNVPMVSRYIRRTTRVWKGYWPGATAPAGAAAHVATIRPNSECWCGRGLLYRDCHLPYEKRMLA